MEFGDAMDAMNQRLERRRGRRPAPSNTSRRRGQRPAPSDSIWLFLACIAVAYGCSSSGATSRDGGSSGAGGSIGTLTGGTTGTGSGGSIIGSTGTGGSSGNQDNPATCAEAAAVRSYVGCEFWPTVTYNPVWSVFDFAAVVANAGDQPA